MTIRQIRKSVSQHTPSGKWLQGADDGPVAQPALLRGWPLFAVIVIVGLIHGFNWPVMAHGVTLVPPVWLGVLRLATGAAVVAAVMAVRGRLRLPLRRDVPVVLSVGVMQLAVVYSLMFVALSLAPAGRSAVLLHTSALWAVPIAAVVLRERYSAVTLVGLALGTTGVVMLLAPWEDGFFDSTKPLGYGLLLAGALLNAVATVHIRAHRWASSPLQLLPWQLGIGSVIAACCAWVTVGPPEIAPGLVTVLVVLYQGVFASAVGVWGILVISRSLTAVSSNLSLMIVPVLGLLSSAVLLSEALPVYVLVGLVLVLLGAAFGIAATRTAPTADG
ncbi:DMT family transporter [Mycobacterium sp. SMC-4]|uniref:DMT family transporter n=1 Tax=Mycobacterium sp. SMC-4 TaxID=2857059 RepID=UPI003D02C3D3